MITIWMVLAYRVVASPLHAWCWVQFSNESWMPWSWGWMHHSIGLQKMLLVSQTFPPFCVIGVDSTFNFNPNHRHTTNITTSPTKATAKPQPTTSLTTTNLNHRTTGRRPSELSLQGHKPFLNDGIFAASPPRVASCRKTNQSSTYVSDLLRCT